MEETQERKEDSTEIQETLPEHKRRRLPVVFALTAGVLIAFFLTAVMMHWIVIFRHGFFFGNAKHITLNIEADEVGKLDYFSGLSSADLTESDAYREIYEWSLRHPEVRVSYTVDLPDHISYDTDTHTIDLTALSYDQTVSAAADYMRYIRETQSAKLNLSGWTYEELQSFHAEYPEIDIIGTLAVSGWSAEELLAFRTEYPFVSPEGTLLIHGARIAFDDETPDVSDMSADGFDALQSVMPELTQVREIDFGREEDGYTKLKGVSGFMKQFPDIKVHYIFTAFDRKINIHTKTLDFNHIPMDDQGREVREILSCMPKVTYLDMDFCGVDDEHMAAIRDDFPDVKVVWRIWFGTGYSVRTDVEKILASAPLSGGELTPENTKSLIYCTDVKYLDIGHNNFLRDVSFVSHMPKLEVLIIMLGGITDISPLADCPHLEFLEIFSNGISDLTPLANLKELKHLNIAYNYRIKDITCLYGLTQLERFWIGTTTSVPKEQIEKFRELAPDCDVNDWVGNPHTNWRWGNERYDLLCEQLGYPQLDYQLIRNDPLYHPHPETNVDMEHVEED